MRHIHYWLPQVRRAGFKSTAPRRAVCRVLERGRNHLSPEEVLRRGQRLCPGLSRATVYRTLDVLRKLGLIRPLHLGATAAQYTGAEGGHHHCVCAACGKVIEFDDCIEKKLARSLEKRLGFRIQSHLLEFYGKCKKCR